MTLGRKRILDGGSDQGVHFVSDILNKVVLIDRLCIVVVAEGNAPIPTVSHSVSPSTLCYINYRCFLILKKIFVILRYSGLLLYHSVLKIITFCSFFE